MSPVVLANKERYADIIPGFDTKVKMRVLNTQGFSIVNTFANFENAFYDRHIWWFLKTLYPHIGGFWMLINFDEGIKTPKRVTLTIVE